MERRHLTREEMLRAVGMLQAGSSQREVSRILETSPSVINRLWSRFNETGGVEERHTGRYRITTAAQDRFLILQARRDRTTTASQLVQELSRVHNVQVSDQTVRNRLHEGQLHSRRPLRVPQLTHGNRASRLAWCQEHVNWDQERWATVLFSDESRFSFYPDSRRIRIWRPPGNQNRLQHAREIVRQGGGSVMFWGGIRLGGRTDLVVLQNNLTGNSYRDEILLPVVVPYLPTMGPNALFQQDNAPPHRARIALSALEENNINILPWPSCSPDLNPIEHVWDTLKRNLLRRNFFQNEQELRLAVQGSWNDLGQNVLDNLILSMPRRCQSVINNRGGPSGY